MDEMNIKMDAIGTWMDDKGLVTRKLISTVASDQGDHKLSELMKVLGVISQRAQEVTKAKGFAVPLILAEL